MLEKKVEVSICKAKEADLSVIAPLFNAYRMFYEQADNIELATTFLRQRLQNAESTVFYAIDDHDKAIGFMQLYPAFSSVSAKKICILNDLYVSAKFRGQGIGRKLIERAKQYAIESGAARVSLETAEDNLAAQRLYESLGYKKNEGFYSYSLSIINA